MPTSIIPSLDGQTLDDRARSERAAGQSAISAAHSEREADNASYASNANIYKNEADFLAKTTNGEFGIYDGTVWLNDSGSAEYQMDFVARPSNIAELKSIKGFGVGSRAIVSGRNIPNDKGGGEFYIQEYEIQIDNAAGYSTGNGITMNTEPLLRSKKEGDVIEFTAGGVFTFTEDADTSDTSITGNLTVSGVSDDERAGMQEDGGTVFETAAGTSSSLRWRREYTGRVFVSWFGAAADGITDDTTAIQTALNRFKDVGLEDGVYLASETLDLSDAQTLTGESRKNTVIYMPGTTAAEIIEIIGDGEASYTNITAEVLPGQYLIDVADPSSFSKDDIVQLNSSELLGYVDSSGTGKPRTITEYGKVKEVDAVNDTIRLYSPVYFRYLISETIQVRRVDMMKNVEIKNLSLQKDFAASVAANDQGRGIVAEYCEDLVIENVNVRETIYTGISLQYCWNPRVSNCNVKNVEASLDVTFTTSYNISVGSLSTHVLIENCYLEDSRHCVSIGGFECVRNVNIVNSALLSAEQLAGMNTPAAADNHFGVDVKYDNCYILGGARVGPLKTTFVNCDIHNGELSLCIGTRGQSVNNRFPREIHVKNCDLYYTGSASVTSRGPIYTLVSEDADTFIEKVTGCNIWMLTKSQYFDLGGSHVTFNNNIVKGQFEPIPPVPVETTGIDEFYRGPEFSQAIYFEAKNNYIEGGITHINTNGVLELGVISNNEFYNGINRGILVHGDNTSPNGIVKLSNNTIINSRDNGVEIEGIRKVVINGVDVEIDHANTDGSHRGFLFSGTIGTLRVLNCSTLTQSVPYAVLGTISDQEHLIGNSFRNVTGTFVDPVVSSGAYHSGNAGWIIENSGTPSGSVIPHFIGEELLDTSNDVWYKAIGLTNTDWVALNS